jgi:nitrogen regulatory protein P-II 1
MKEIKAVIRPNKLASLRDALVALPGFPGMTVSKVEGCSAPNRHLVPHNIKEQLTDYTPKQTGRHGDQDHQSIWTSCGIRASTSI